jgi:hypothetical protein
VQPKACRRNAIKFRPVLAIYSASGRSGRQVLLRPSTSVRPYGGYGRHGGCSVKGMPSPFDVFLGYTARPPERPGPAKLNAVCLRSGARARMELRQHDVALTEEVGRWMADLVFSRRMIELPGSVTPGWKARAADYGGGLALSVYAEDDCTLPLLTMGVALRANHGPSLWRVLTALPGADGSIVSPVTPWCALLPRMHPGAEAAAFFLRLVDFAPLCAAAWADRPRSQRRGFSGNVVSNTMRTIVLRERVSSSPPDADGRRPGATTADAWPPA